MNGLIRETNENLKAIINTMKENVDAAGSILENIQAQMDKKVEEAKKYKIQVDSAKETIRKIEQENKNLELSLNELNEKYSKMNLVSLIEAGNKEIKAKINDNIKEINKNKEQIAELTSKARTIKDLLMNLKKDKTSKEERLENLKAVYEYYSINLNEIIDYAYENSNDLKLLVTPKKEEVIEAEEEIVEEIKSYNDLENTMIFDEIADIDGNKNFKDEMTFIDGEIDTEMASNDYNKLVERIAIAEQEKQKADAETTKLFEGLEKDNEEEIEESEDEIDIDLNDLESTQVFDSIMSPEYSYDESVEAEEEEEEEDDDETTGYKGFIEDDNEEEIIEDNFDEMNDFITSEEQVELEEDYSNDYLNIGDNIEEELNLDIEPEIEDDTNFVINEEPNIDTNIPEYDSFDDFENPAEFETINSRADEIDNFLTNIENTKTETINLNSVEEKLDNVLTEESTLTDIFGNPIKSKELDKEISTKKTIEEFFVENGIDFNKFKEDEIDYLKQIYDENNFSEIFNVLNKYRINVDNLYNAFNIFGEIKPMELDELINKFISIGQSVEVIGYILEKLPKVKKYNLDEAIASFNDEIENVNITELIIRAKELYNGGNK